MRVLSTVFLILACVLLGSCAGYRSYEEGRKNMIEGNSLVGLANLEEAVKASPKNATYRQAYEREKHLFVARMVAEGDMLRVSGDLNKAEVDYRQALRFEPANERSKTGLALIEQKRKNIQITREARVQIDDNELDKAEAALRGALVQDPDLREARDLLNRISDKRIAQAQATPPALKTAFTKPITLEFRDASLKSV